MDELHQQIEKYLRGELTGEQLEAFEKQLKEDTLLAQEFQLEKDIFASVQAYGQLKRKQELQQLHNEEVALNGLQRFIRKWYSLLLWIGAILGLAIIAWIVSKNLQSDPGPQQLFAEYSEYAFKYTVKSSDTLALLVQIETFLSEENFNEALPLLDEYLSQNPNDSEILLAKGIAILKTDQDDEDALKLFMQVVDQDNAYLADSYWLIALTYLKSNQIQESKEYLNKIPATSRKAALAQQLIQSIEKADLD